MADRLPTESNNITWPTDLDTDAYHGWYMGRGRSVYKIIKAAIDGDLAIVQSCIQEEPELVHCNIHYREPLYFAVGNNHLDVAQYLIENGAEITYKSGNRNHQRNIQRAEDREFTEMAKLLKNGLEKQFDVLYRSEGEELAKHIRENSLSAVLEILTQNPEYIKAIDERGNQPIHWAVLAKNTKMIDALLEKGANLEAQRPDGARPIDLTVGDYFFRAQRRMASFLCGYLVAKGAQYPLEHAASQNDLARVKEIVEADPKIVNKLPDYFTWYTSTALSNAAIVGATNIVKYLLEKGADPNICQPGFAPQGNALMDAIAKKQKEITNLLLDAGADPNQAVESSSNCCGWAKNDPDLLQTLVEKGGQFGNWENLKDIDPDLLTKMFGDIPLRYYVDNNDPEGLQKRLSSNPESAHQIFPATIGKRALMDVCLNANPNVMKSLLPDHVLKLIKNEDLSDLKEQALAHANLSKPNWIGITQLHDIAGYGKQETQITDAELLIEHGANIESVDEEYASTPLGWAARQGQTEMVSFLLNKGANPRGAETFEWASPLAWAQKRGHHETAAIIEKHL